jgi:hypothetical protein
MPVDGSNAQSLVVAQADHYQKYCCRNARAHFIAAHSYQIRHYWIGVPAIFASTVVGTTIFASMSNSASETVKIVAGCLSIAAAFLSGLLTFLNYGDRSKEHKVAATKYSSLRRDFELLIISMTYGNDTAVNVQIDKLSVIMDKLSDVASEVPNVPEGFWKAANKEVPVPPAHESPLTIAVRGNVR